MDTLNHNEISIIQDGPQNDAQIEAMMKIAFGPGRFTKAAHFLRLDNKPDYALSKVAFIGGELIGACRIWPIVFQNGEICHFLGPIVISPMAQNKGIGTLLVDACLKAIEQSPIKSVLLIGDIEFFGKFGFKAVEKNSITLPLPAINNRILGLNLSASLNCGIVKPPQNAMREETE